VDFSYLLDPPAGKHGFLQKRKDGRFYFSDGTEGRFWGINIANRSVFQPPDVIDRAVEAIARAGFNLVRIHHIDERNGIIKEGDDTRHLDEARLRLLDYWIAQLKLRGIYVYLDLLDYRTFKPGDGVENAAALGRGAKPYALFNRRLIELQKEYARQLLVEHVNPFTGLCYAEDPAIVMLELFDENGLFMKRNLWRQMPAPFDAEFKSLWNDWLREQYRSTDQLARAWTNYRGEKALRPDERIETNSVELPNMKLSDKQGQTYAASLDSPARRNDGVRFAYDLQRRYFAEMRSYLRGLGVRVPLTAVTSSDDLADLKSVADELDFIGNNFYWDHPFWKADQEWQFPYFFLNRNPIAESGNTAFAPSVTMSCVRNVPLVVREWQYCWPNRYRAAGIVEAVAYACLQDISAMIIFTLGAHEEANKLEFFDCHLDPARWGLVGMAAQAFLRRDISPADCRVEIAFSPTDIFTCRSFSSDLYQLAFVSRLQNSFLSPVEEAQEAETAGELTLRIACGRSAQGRLPGRRNLIRCNDSRLDIYDRERQQISEALQTYGISPTPNQGALPQTFIFDGVFLGEGRKNLPTVVPFPVEMLKEKKFQPIGLTPDGRYAFGFFDPRQQNFVFTRLSDAETLRVALDALGFLEGKKISRRCLSSGELVSDNGQVRRNTRTGRIAIVTPHYCALAGMLKGAGVVKLGPVTITPSSEVGAIVVSSLDQKALGESRRLHIKCVSNAANTGQTDLFQRVHQRYMLSSAGNPPILTYGSISTRPTRVLLVSGMGVEVYQENGTWELVMEFGKCYFFSDTRGVPVKIIGVSPNARVISYNYDNQCESFLYGGILTYPANAALVRIE